MNLDVKAHVASGNTVQFLKYQQGNLYYEVNQTSLVFKVPIADLGDATCYQYERAMTYMKYIKKALDELKEADAVHQNESSSGSSSSSS
jgi:hypothetical protein